MVVRQARPGNHKWKLLASVTTPVPRLERLPIFPDGTPAIVAVKIAFPTNDAPQLLFLGDYPVRWLQPVAQYQKGLSPRHCIRLVIYTRAGYLPEFDAQPRDSNSALVARYSVFG